MEAKIPGEESAAAVEPHPPRQEAAPAEGRCGSCGAFTTVRVGEEWICESCYVLCGSCCAGE